MTDWLVPEADRIETPFLGRKVEPVECVIYHYTASPQGRGPWGSSRARIERWLSGGSSRSSTHFVVLRDGTIIQGAPIDARTWHAGRSSFRGRGGVNAFSIGVDMENVGRLVDKHGRWADAYDNPVADGEVLADPKDPARFAWELYTPHQIDAVCRLAEQLARQFPVLVDPDRHVGHEHVSPGRKLDPGPAFPWGEIHDTVTHLPAESACV